MQEMTGRVDSGDERAATRISGELVPIGYDETLSFFEERALRAETQPLLTAVLYQDAEPELAERRDRAEWDLVSEWLTVAPEARVLDVGCGVGRWGGHLAGRIGSYLGVDFSPGLVDLARVHLAELMGGTRWAVQVGSAPELGSIELELPGPFDLVIVAGVLIYLNDDDVRRTLASIGDLSAPGSMVFIREPVAVEERLTLRSHWSEELNQPYSAVYRGADEYRSAIQELLGPSGFELIRDQPMDVSLRNRAETSQHYFLAARR